MGVAAIGYGDGYPRIVQPGTPVLVNGRQATIVGRVSMDLMTIDLRGQPDAFHPVQVRARLLGGALQLAETRVLRLDQLALPGNMLAQFALRLSAGFNQQLDARFDARQARAVFSHFAPPSFPE